MESKNQKDTPPPDPNDFDDPITRGWHALTNDGWAALKPTATLELLPSSFGTHHFSGKVAGWNYEF